MTRPASLAAKTVLAASVAAGASLLLAGCYNDAHEYRQLVDSNASITGSVAYVDCNSHGLVVYSFVVGGREYRAKAPPRTIPCETAHRGDPVAVTYDPAHPDVNTLLAPQEAYEQARGWYVPVPALICGGFVLAIAFNIALYGRRRSTRRAVGDQGSVK